MTIFDIFYRIQEDIIPVIIPETHPTDSVVKHEVSMMEALPVDELINRFIHGLVSLAINLTVAIFVFYLGKFIIRKIYNIVGRILINRQIDSSLMTFILSFVKIVLYFILIVTVIGILGIETSSFLALFASAGVAIGMALSGTLQNFAGGVLILLLKPYRVGDYIEAQGFGGIVKEIQIFHTIIITFDNKAISIPNGSLSTGSINNWNREEARRVDWNVAISYGDSIETAREAILEIINKDRRILHAQKNEDDECEETESDDRPLVARNSSKSDEDCPEDETQPDTPKKRGIIASFFRKKRKKNQLRDEYIRQQVEAQMPNPVKEPSVVVTDLADSSVVLKARAWVKTEDYWPVFYHLYEQIYTELPKSGVSFPFPQMDVHLDSKNN